MKLLVTLLLASFTTLNAHAKMNIGCEEYKTLFRIEHIRVLADHISQHTDLELMSEAMDTICRHSGEIGSTVSYDNGQVATRDFNKPGATWYYSNGQIITTSAGLSGAALFYPNGKEGTDGTFIIGGRWFYSSGQMATPEFNVTNGVWFYPNGTVGTKQAGVFGGSWFYPNQAQATNNAGDPTATWLHSSGDVIVNILQFTEQDLLDASRVMLWLLVTDPDYYQKTAI